ncbi:MAG: hypothetical protein AAGG81_03665 [Chlamydiota bacterium]
MLSPVQQIKNSGLIAKLITYFYVDNDQTSMSNIRISEEIGKRLHSDNVENCTCFNVGKYPNQPSKIVTLEFNLW